MGVLYKGLSAGELFMHLAIPQDQIDWLKANSVNVKVHANEIQFTVSNINMSVPVKLDHLQQLKIGTLHNLPLTKMANDIRQAIKTIQKKVGHQLGIDPAPTVDLEAVWHAGTVTGKFSGAEPTFESVPKTSKMTSGVLALLAKNKVMLDNDDVASQPVQVEPVVSGPYQEFPINKLGTAPTVPLTLADRMYQPVRGTSASSRYFLVGAGDTIKVAARYENSSLSVRVEATDGMAKHVERLQACGFNGATAGVKYASMHLNVDDPVLAAKAMGAVLMGLGIKIHTPLPNLSLIRNKGA